MSKYRDPKKSKSTSYVDFHDDLYELEERLPDDDSQIGLMYYETKEEERLRIERNEYEEQSYREYYGISDDDDDFDY